jgi:hypothetical protein
MLRSQARMERHQRIIAESRASYQRRGGATATSAAQTQQHAIGHMEREIGVQREIARWGSAMGLEETVLKALRSISWLQDRIALLGQEIRRAPYEDAVSGIRDWQDALAARMDLLESMRAPASDVQRLLWARVRALEAEAGILRQMGQYAGAERALARASRLRMDERQDSREPALERRIQQVIGGDPRGSENVAPLAVSQSAQSGGARRYVVEFQAPSDRGGAIVDALIDEVMRRLGTTLRAQR